MGNADRTGVSRRLPITLFLVLCIGALTMVAFRKQGAINVRGRPTGTPVYTLDAA